MKNQHYKNWTLPVVLMSAIAAPAHANDCFDRSPLMDSLGEAYAQLDYPANDGDPDGYSAKYKSTDKLLNSLSNKSIRSGKGVRVSCKGLNSHVKEISTRFELTDVEFVETASGKILMTAWEESSRKVASTVVDLPPAHYWQRKSNTTFKTSQLFRRVNRNVNEGISSDSETIANTEPFSENHLELLGDAYLYGEGSEAQSILNNPEQTVRPINQPIARLLENPNREGSYVAEIETQVSKTFTGYKVMQIFYVNGYKAEWVTWNLDT